MEAYKSKERNIEDDRREFIKAIDLVVIEEIPTEFNEAARLKLVDNLSETKLFILGEMHGVKENVDIIYTLIKKFGFRTLALEWETSLQQVVERYIETGEIDFDSIQDSPDGRITAGHFALLKKLKEEGLLEKFLCYDGSGEFDWNARDENMAKNILSELSDSPMLVVAGNLHASVDSITFDDEPGERHPMGGQIKTHIPQVPSGKINYESGHYHNFGVRDFSNDSDNVVLESKFSISADGSYIFTLPVATPAMVPNPGERLV